MAKTPTIAEQELDKLKDQFDKFDGEVKEMTQDRMSKAPVLETEPQTKLSTQELEKSKEIYLKPKRQLSAGVNPKTGVREQFNEKFRDEYNFQKEYVRIIAENNEIIGETLEFWTKPFPGMNAEEWAVPTNKPVWVPRYVAERIKGCTYHRLSMKNNVVGEDNNAQYYGTMAVDTTLQRLDARPANSTRKSIFMGATSF